MVKICRMCAITITNPSGPGQLYCSSCSTIAAKEADKRKLIKYRLKKGSLVGVGKGHAQGTGKGHHSYRSGIKNFAVRYLSTLNGDYKCAKCEKDLHDVVLVPGKRSWWCVHHKDGDRSNNENENLELLCKRCHQVHHNCVGNLPVKV